ncbi:hypothetical protein GGG16DRAFT_106987, partial [Schizophyllum commune]
ASAAAAAAAAAAPPTPKVSVSLDVISRRLCQPPRRVLDMVVVPAGLQNAKSTSIVPRSAPVPLGDCCDTGFWWAGGDERRGAPLRYPRHELLITYGRWRICATSSAERCLASESWDFVTPSKTKKSANRRQMDRVPRLKFSLMLATVGGGEGAARSATYNSVSALPRGHGPPTLLSESKRLDAMQRRFVSFGRRCESSLSTLAAQYRTSPTISSNFYATSPPLKQRIDVPRARSFPSSATLALHSATLFEPPAPLATPSILVPTYSDLSVPTPHERFDFFVGLS